MIEIIRTCFPGGAWNHMVAMGVRNSFDSWKDCDTTSHMASFGEKDLELLTKLSGCDSSERKFLRMMPVLMDINAPLYFWKEFDTYKVGTVSNSCSTMHKIMANPFNEQTFSTDQMLSVGGATMVDIIQTLNDIRGRWLECTDPQIKKELWYTIIQLLPSSWNQLRTVMLNYEVLKTMYKQRRNHKLGEWRGFCDYISKKMPYPEFITGGKKVTRVIVPTVHTEPPRLVARKKEE